MSPLYVPWRKDALVVLTTAWRIILVEAMHDQLGLGWFWLDGGSRFSAYSPLRVYCGRLMMPCERRSMEPLAAVTARGREATINRSARFCRAGGWSDERVLAKVRHQLLPCDRHDRSADGPSTATAGDNGVYAYGGPATAGLFQTNIFDADDQWASGLPALARRLGAWR